MIIASFVLAIVAVLVALASAVYTARQASAAEGVLAIERDRRLEERRPRMSAWISPLGDEDVKRLFVRLESREALARVDVQILPGVGLYFLANQPYVDSPDEYDAKHYRAHADWRDSDQPYPGHPGAPEPGHTMSWAMDGDVERGKPVLVDVTCHGEQGERWVITIYAEVR
jgi:hypothetical protein